VVIARHPKYGPAPEPLDLDKFRGAGRPVSEPRKAISCINGLRVH
jgi:hypothetical protein